MAAQSPMRRVAHSKAAPFRPRTRQRGTACRAEARLSPDPLDAISARARGVRSRAEREGAHGGQRAVLAAREAQALETWGSVCGHRQDPAAAALFDWCVANHPDLYVSN